MFRAMIKTLAGFGRSKFQVAVLASASLAGLASLPTAAFARHPSFQVDVAIPAPVCEPVPPVYVQPHCQPQRVWVEPVYQDVTEQVWVPAQTTTRIQRVDVPAEYAWRDVIAYDRFGWAHRSRQQVEIAPARCEDRPVEVIICPGHFEQQAHQRLVCEGHWQQVTSPPVVERPGVRIGFRFPF